MAAAATPLRVVLLGPPASGKGTQGRRLAHRLGLGYLGTGALLREEIERGTLLGQQAQPILARGGYLPDELMCPIVADWLSRQSGGWVLDGFPRSLPQAEFLDHWLASRNLKLDAAVLLEVPLPELLARIADRVECPDCRWTGQRAQLKEGNRCPDCGHAAQSRADDDVESFLSRHAEFEHNVQPVIDHYHHTGLLVTCDATAPQEDVASHLLQLISSRAV